MKYFLILAAVLVVLRIAGAPSDSPVLFAEGVVSTQDDESGFALTPDGKTAFFGKTSPATTGDPLRVICVTHLDAHGRWTTPEIAPFSGRYHDLGPAFAPAGSRLYFISDRPNGDPEKHDLNIWYVERIPSGWSAPEALGAPINSPANEYGVSVAAKGAMYFASSRAAGKGSFDIYRSVPENGEYKTVENLGDAINTKGPELYPAISPDENILVFAALGRDDETIGVHQAYARGDLYVSFRKNGVWTAARNAGTPINSGGGESWPGFSSDGSRFFFSSDRGFATYRLPHRLTWSQFEHGLTSTLNGMGNIYQISADALRATH
jgi:hypothetical protein